MEIEENNSASDKCDRVIGAQATDDSDLCLDGLYQHEEASETELSQGLFFEQVKKMVAKSVKRKEKRNTVCKQKRKRSKINGHVDDALPIAYSRCSVSYFYEIIKAVLKSPHFIKLVKEMGFGDLLKIDDCYIPRVFAQWIADHTIPKAGAILINDMTIPLTADSVKDVLNIPAGILDVEGDEEAEKIGFLALFGLTEVPPISFFGKEIL